MPTLKILRAHQTPADPVENTKASLYVQIEIEGYTTGVGGLPIFDSRDELIVHLESRYDELLEKAQGRPPDDDSLNRWDLIDDVFKPRDLSTEVDELKARIIALEVSRVEL